MDSSCCDFKENYLGKTSPVQSQVTSRVISDWVGVKAMGTEGDMAMSYGSCKNFFLFYSRTNPNR